MSVKININGQPVDILDESQLAIVHNKTKTVDNWLLSTFFGTKLSFNGRDAVPLDELDTTQPLAPFVSPTAQGKPLVSAGEFKRDYVKAPYLKPADIVTPDTVYDSALLALLQQGGIIRTTNGKLSDEEKLRIAQITKFNRLRQSIDNRKTLMAADILTKGKTLCIGDDHPAYEINFNRHSDLTFTPSTKWEDSGATVVADIERMIELAIEHGGTSPTVAVMSSKVFNAMKANKEFKERLQLPLGTTAPDIFAPRFTRTDKPMYRGNFDGIDFWTYDVAHHLYGKPQRFIGEKAFYLISDTSGYQASCMIKHLDAYGQALEYFDYQAIDKDPSVIKLICEASPLILPSNPNGVVGGDAFLT